MGTTEKQKYDYIVIGGGSGGSGSARRAAGWYGAKTLIVESGRSGGTCVNVGCVPKKMTWNFASINETLEVGRHYGYDIPEDININYNHFKNTRDAVIKRLNGAYERNWNREGIDLVHGRARFVEPKTIEVDTTDGGKAQYTADHILIAAGGRPNIPKVKGAEHGITSDGFFELEDLPPKFAVVGAGYIAVELAGVLGAVGVDTHMFIRGENFLRKFDPMIQKTMTDRYVASGINVHRNHEGFKEVQLVRDGKGKDKLLRLVCMDDTVLEVNELLWATRSCWCGCKLRDGAVFEPGPHVPRIDPLINRFPCAFRNQQGSSKPVKKLLEDRLPFRLLWTNIHELTSKGKF